FNGESHAFDAFLRLNSKLPCAYISNAWRVKKTQADNIEATTPATLNWHSDGYMAHESSRAGPCWAGNYMLDGMKLATGLAVSAEQGSEEGSLELLVRGKCVKKKRDTCP
ncbi:hypothetical protein HID58_091372, partial [Brassica napus]